MRLLRTGGMTLPFSITKDPNSEVAHLVASHTKGPIVEVESFQRLRDELVKRGKKSSDSKLVLKRPEVNDNLPNVIFRTFNTHITPPLWARFFKNTDENKKICNMSRMLNESMFEYDKDGEEDDEDNENNKDAKDAKDGKDVQDDKDAKDGKDGKDVQDDENDPLFYSEEFLFRPVLSGHILGGDGEMAVLGFEDIEDAKELASNWPDSKVLTLDTEKAIIHAEAMNLPFLLIKPALRGGNLKGGAPREAKIFGYI